MHLHFLSPYLFFSKYFVGFTTPLLFVFDIMGKISKCLVCDSKNWNPVYQASNVPLVPNAPLSNEQLTGEHFVSLDIVACASCGLVFNSDFDASFIDKIYVNNYSSGISQSTENIKRLEEIITTIITPQKVAHRTVVEIGASDFAFSELMIKHGASKVIAFEPSDLFTVDNANIVHVPTLFSVDAVPGGFHNVGLVVMRHVLEHLPDPLEAIRNMSQKAAPGTAVYIEVPNVHDIIAHNRFYDFFYEHVTYWSPSLLSKVMESFGFKTIAVSDLVEGQHFGVLCTKQNQSALATAGRILDTFCYEGCQLAKETKKYLDILERNIMTYKKVSIYGAGNHGLGVLSCLSPRIWHHICCVLDGNELKHGQFAPKSHIPIMKPTQSLIDSLDAIFVIAPLHQGVICDTLSSKFNFQGDLWKTHPNIVLQPR